MDETKLAVKKGRLVLKNPILAASGTFGYGKEFEPFFDVSALGGITIKGTTLSFRPGNVPPRIFESGDGLLNSIGLANPGIHETVRIHSDYFRALISKGCAVVANLSGGTLEEFAELVGIADAAGCFSHIEINVSCPNVKEGGISFSHSPESVEGVVKAVRGRTNLPLITKLSPNVMDIRPFVTAAENGGTDIVSLVNTYKGLSIDCISRRPRFANTHAGYSGPAIKPLALYAVSEARKATNLPIIGMGGISSRDDALEFILAGADAIETGTMNLIDPAFSWKLLCEMSQYFETEQISVTQLTGAAFR